MPYLKPSDDSYDDIEIFYEVYRAGCELPRPVNDPFTSCSYLDHRLNPTASGSSLDKTKETILLIPEIVTDTTIYVEQIRYDELRMNYNLVAVDPRYHGRTRAKYNASWDWWSAAAECMSVLDFLGVRKFHVYAANIMGCSIALRISTMYPDRVLSLSLDGVGFLGEEKEERLAVFGEMAEQLMYSEDEGEVLDVLDEITYVIWGDRTNLTIDQYDYLNAIMTRRCGPRCMARYYMIIRSLLGRSRVPINDLNNLSCPVLIFRGTQDACYPGPEATNELIAVLKSVPGGVKLFEWEGAGSATHFTKSDLVNPVFVSFLRTHRQPSSDLLYGPRSLSDLERKDALRKLAKFANLPDVADRPPEAPISFSIMTPPQIQETEETLQAQVEHERKGMRIRGDDGPETWEDVPYDQRFQFRMSQRDCLPLSWEREKAIEVNILVSQDEIIVS